jgi:hypothetical protein
MSVMVEGKECLLMLIPIPDLVSLILDYLRFDFWFLQDPQATQSTQGTPSGTSQGVIKDKDRLFSHFFWAQEILILLLLESQVRKQNDFQSSIAIVWNILKKREKLLKIDAVEEMARLAVWSGELPIYRSLVLVASDIDIEDVRSSYFFRQNCTLTFFLGDQEQWNQVDPSEKEDLLDGVSEEECLKVRTHLFHLVQGLLQGEKNV